MSRYYGLDMNVPSLRIVAATAADVPLILELIRGLAEYERLGHLVIATEERLRESLFGAKPAAEVLLAYHDSECAGFAIFFPVYSTFLAQAGVYLEDLFVRPHLRGRGFGLALLAAVARIAVERDCGRVEWGVLAWNRPSIEFYRKLGAVPLDEWTKYRLDGQSLTRLASGPSAPGGEE
jgi:GNAT superfamily N-acetyltransferase